MEKSSKGREAGSTPTGSLTSREPSQFLADLSQERAFWLFFGGLIVGIALIFLDLPGGWSTTPVVPVVAYGLLLRFASVEGDRRLSPQEKDSPYFMGFILTLVALFMIFWSAKEGGPLTMAVIGPRAGAAILVTVVGLVMRQFLIAVEPFEDIEVDGFEKLSGLAIKRLRALVKQEGDFHELTREMQKNREELWKREEGAINALISNYEVGTRRLASELEKASEVVSLGDDVRARLRDFEAHLGDATSALRAIVTKLEELAGTWVKTIRGLQSNASEALKEHAKELQQLGPTTRGVVATYETEVERLTSSFEEVAGTWMKTIGGLQSNTSEALKEHAKELQQLAPTTREVVATYETEVERLTSSTSEAVSAVKVVSAEMKTISAALKGLSEQTANTTKQVQEEITRDLRTIAGDVKRIDEIVDQLVEVLGKSLDNFSDSR